MSALGPVIGVLFDRHGPQPLLMVGSFLHVFGLMMASISSQYYQFMLSQGVCSAFGVAAVFLSTIGCVSGWFDRRRGLAFGGLATGSSVGGVVLPIMLSKLIDSAGYAWAMRAGAFLIAALLSVANVFIRRRQGIPRRGQLSQKLMVKPFYELPFVLLLGGLSLVPFGHYTPINFLPTAAIRAGIAKPLANNLVAFFNGSRWVPVCGVPSLSLTVGVVSSVASCLVSLQTGWAGSTSSSRRRTWVVSSSLPCGSRV